MVRLKTSGSALPAIAALVAFAVGAPAVSAKALVYDLVIQNGILNRSNCYLYSFAADAREIKLNLW